MQSDDQVAALLRDLRRHQLIERRRLGVAEVRRAEERRAPSEHRFEESLRGVELELGALVAREREIRMQERVVPDQMSFVHDAAQERQMPFRVLADEEEGGGHAA